MHLAQTAAAATVALAISAVVACDNDSSPSATTAPDAGTASPDGAGPTSSGPVTPEDLLARGGCVEAAGAGTDHSGGIAADEVWTAAASPHRIKSSLDISATVTIEPCAVVELGAAVDLRVGSATTAGKLIAKGAGGGGAVRPVTFRAADAPAPWGQIAVEPRGTADLSLATLVEGGKSTTNAGALFVRGVATGTNDGAVTRSVTLDRVLVEKSASYGIHLDGWGTLTEGSSQVWIRGSGSAENPYAVRLEPGIAGTLPKGLSATGNRRNEILLQTSKPFMRDDTLLALGLPYRALGPIYVGGSTDGAAVKLTIEAGVTVGFEDNAGSGIIVGNSAARKGALVAVGTAAAPIVLTSAKDAKAPGDWTNVTFRYTTYAEDHLSFVRVEYAGANSGTNSFGCGPGSNDSAIIVQGQAPNDEGPGPTFIENTTFDDIAGTTVVVSGWTSDSGPNLSQGNTFGASTPSCKVSKPKRSGGGDVCDGGRTTCWP